MDFVFFSVISVQISRMLAAKASLAIRYDALGEDTNAEMGAENRAKLEVRLRQLEERGVSTTTTDGYLSFFGMTSTTLKCT